jgi:2-hydroxychromene-2-carboxylate isomerase
LAAALADPAVKERLRTETEAALAKGMFGAPYVIIDGEAFWGADRLPQIERWLASGGF